MRRQNKEQRDEEQHLPREGEENRLVRLAYILEKIGGHDLESDDRENAQHDPQPLGRRRDHPLGRSSVRSIDEEHRHLPGKELSQQESRRRHANRTHDSLPQDLQHPVVPPGAVIVPHDGLHALIQSRNDHQEEHRHPINDAIRPDRHVATVLPERFVHDDHYRRSTEVQQKRSHTDRKDLAHDRRLQAENPPFEPDETSPGREVDERNRECCDLGQHRRGRRTANTPAEPENEQRIEQTVQHDGRQHNRHGSPRITRSTNHFVQAQIHMGNDRTAENDLHEIACITDRGIARPEEAENGVQQQQTYGRKKRRYQKIEQHHIAQHPLGSLPTSLSQPDRGERRSTDPDQRPESRRDVHQRHRKRHAGNGDRTDAVSDENAIDDVVERRRGHRDNRRDRITDEQRRNPVGT